MFLYFHLETCSTITLSFNADSVNIKVTVIGKRKREIGLVVQRLLEGVLKRRGRLLEDLLNFNQHRILLGN